MGRSFPVAARAGTCTQQQLPTSSWIRESYSNRTGWHGACVSTHRVLTPSITEYPGSQMVDIKRKPQGKTKQYVMYALGTVALIAMTWFFMTLEAAPPTVESAIIWTGTVERGELLRQVRGPGTLVPENVLFVSARTAGRIDQILLDAGANVTPDSVIMILANPDLELQVLQAEWQLRGAEATYTQQRVTLEQGRLQQQSQVAQVQAAYHQARLQADRDTQLYEESLVSQITMEISNSRAAAPASPASAATARSAALRPRVGWLRMPLVKELNRLAAAFVSWAPGSAAWPRSRFPSAAWSARRFSISGRPSAQAISAAAAMVAANSGLLQAHSACLNRSSARLSNWLNKVSRSVPG